jgi:hypothetical protein
MKARRTQLTAKDGTLSSRPPRAVNVRSAEGYVARLPGVERRNAPRITVAETRGVLESKRSSSQK